MNLGVSGRLTRATIASPLTPLFLLAAIAVGLLALLSIPREEEPQISVPMVDILVTANGYKADDAVELIAKPLEDIVRTSEGKDQKLFNSAAQSWNHGFYWESLSAQTSSSASSGSGNSFSIPARPAFSSNA